MKTQALLIIAMMFAAAPAEAQTRPLAVNQTNAGGAATMQSHMKSLGYKNIHDLHQGPDGQWVGKGTQNGVSRTVTVEPNGATIAR